jgi:VWFA-related protein
VDRPALARASLVAAVLLSPALAAQGPPFRSGVDVVLVDLTVLDGKDNPVPGLRNGDIELRIDGKERPIRTLAFLEAARRTVTTDLSAPGSLPGGELGRTIVLVVDRESILGGQGQQVLGAAQAFADRVAPADRLALATMPDPGGRLRFNEPRDELKRRLGKAVGTWFSAPTAHTIFPWEAIEIARQNQEVLEQVAQRECPRPSESSPEAYATCRSQISMEARIVADARRREVDAGLQALRTLFAALGALEGPKHVVLIAGGLAESTDDLLSVASLARVAAASRVWVHVLQVTSGGNPDWVETEQRGLPSRPPRLPASSAAVNLATATGGLAFAPVAGEAFFARLEKQLAGAYLLAFDPEPSDRDGRPHRIEVRVPRREGVTVRARREFVARPLPTSTTATSPVPAPPTPAAAPAPTVAPAAAAPAAAPAAPAPVVLQATSDPAVRAIVQKMAAYVASYGESAALFVAAERYDQRIELGPGSLRPHTLKSEFAIVRTKDAVGWTGLRDVVEADGTQVVDRRDRLQALLTGVTDPRAEVRRIADESARYNVGPVMRNFNLPTTALFFFHPSQVGRFAFTSKGSKKVDGTPVVQLDFVEVARPTLVGKRDGTDVPSEGSVWVVPEDGTVVRTRVRLNRFADYVGMGDFDPHGRESQPRAVPQPSPQPAPSAPPPPPPQPSPGTSAGPSGGGQVAGGAQAAGQATSTTPAVTQTSSGEPGDNANHPIHMSAMFPAMQRIDSRASVEVTFSRDPRFGVWLPSKMSESYEGPIQHGTRGASSGSATAVAKYTDYRRFETSATLVSPR